MKDFADNSAGPRVDEVTSSLLQCVRAAYGPQVETKTNELAEKQDSPEKQCEGLFSRMKETGLLNFAPSPPTRSLIDKQAERQSLAGSSVDSGGPARDALAFADMPANKGRPKKERYDSAAKGDDVRPEAKDGIAEGDKRPSPLVALDKLKEIPELTKLIDTLKEKNIESASFEQTKDGKMAVVIKYDKARHVELNEKIGFGTVKSVDIDKEVTYTLSRTDKGLKIDDLKGISAQVNILGKDINQQLPSATIERDQDGKPVENQFSKISAKLGLDDAELCKFSDMLSDQHLTDFKARRTGAGRLSLHLETEAGTKTDVDLRKVSDNVTNVRLKRNDADHIPLNRKEGPVTVHGLDLGKSISFDLVSKGKDITFANLSGVTLNVSILRERDLQVRSVTVHHDKQGNPDTAIAEISRPVLKNRSKTVTVPLKEGQ